LTLDIYLFNIIGVLLAYFSALLIFTPTDINTC